MRLIEVIERRQSLHCCLWNEALKDVLFCFLNSQICQVSTCSDAGTLPCRAKKEEEEEEEEEERGAECITGSPTAVKS